MKPVIRKIHKDGSFTIPAAMLKQLGWTTGTKLEVLTSHPVMRVSGKWWIWLRKAP